MKQAPLTVRRWKRVEYERLVDLGAFDVSASTGSRKAASMRAPGSSTTGSSM
jgi:hypothetical protein